MHEKSLNIMIVNHYTKRGGIPKFVVRLANAMIKRGHKVTLYSQKPIPRILYPLYKIKYAISALSLPPNEKPAPPHGYEQLGQMYHLDSNVQIKYYKSTDKNLQIQKLRDELRQLNPDVCVCPLADGHQMLWAVTLLGTGIPYVCSERHSPATIENMFSSREVRLAAMSGADAIHLMFQSFVQSIPEIWHERIHVIPNAVDIPSKQAMPKGENDKNYKILWLARLDDDLKQWRLAIDAFALIAKQYPQWEMHIAGDGQDRSKVKTYAAELHLDKQLVLLGEVHDVESAYASSHIYCFSSRTEGMPNSLLEAMSSGLACIAFAKCEGVQELIEHEHNGLIVEDMTTEAMAKGLERLILDAELRQRLGDNARLSMQKYNEGSIFDAWDSLIKKAAACKGNTALDAFSKDPLAAKARLVACARREWLWRDFGYSMPLHSIVYSMDYPKGDICD